MQLVVAAVVVALASGCSVIFPYDSGEPASADQAVAPRVDAQPGDFGLGEGGVVDAGTPFDGWPFDGWPFDGAPRKASCMSKLGCQWYCRVSGAATCPACQPLTSSAYDTLDKCAQSRCGGVCAFLGDAICAACTVLQCKGQLVACGQEHQPDPTYNCLEALVCHLSCDGTPRPASQVCCPGSTVASSAEALKTLQACTAFASCKVGPNCPPALLGNQWGTCVTDCLALRCRDAFKTCVSYYDD